MDKGREFTSAYNEGMLQIQRLHFLWVKANNQSVSGNYKGWLWTLDSVWRELSRDALKKEFGKLEPGEFESIKTKSAWFKDRERIKQGITDSIKVRDLGLTYELMTDYEVFLRTLQDSVGKGGKYRDEDEDGMD